MALTRRKFLAASGTAGTGSLLGFLGLDMSPTVAYASQKITAVKRSRITTTICPYCAVGCGILVMSEGKADDEYGRRRVVVHVEGDPDHPINEGTLCPKGASLFQLANNNKRLHKVLYRKSGATDFEEKDWSWAAREIAKRIKQTRDATFVEKNAKGEVVNRTTGIASVGSAALDNEECWLFQKLLRGLGLVFIEHQARICHSSTVASLAATFGRGAMTNHWIDIQHSDCILMMGGNPAECHPVAMRWVLKAQENGATVISVDPRFTRSSAVADIYAPLRAGTDIAFLGGLIKYIFDNGLIHRDYVVNYTNAALLINDEFDFQEAEGVFSGYDPQQRKYDKSSWQYQVDEGDGNGEVVEPLKDPTLRHPQCAYELMKKHYARYDLETVSGVTGTPVGILKRVYEAFASTAAPNKTGTIMYAMGWTQHTVGTQYIRSMAMIQLLLGNIGRAGGGVNALRGESNVQGSTDHCLLFHILPGYLKTPKGSQTTLAAYQKACTPRQLGKRSANWWANYPKYSVSYLKSMFGDAATPENQFGYVWMPKLDDGVDYSWLSLFDEMSRGTIRGFFCWGQNPACSSTNANKVRKALAKLDWLVNVNVFPSETGWFFQDKSLGIRPEEIKTEVFVLPAAASAEKEGSITNSGRWMQWRYKAADPPGMARPDAEIMNMIYQELKKLYAADKDAKLPGPILNLKWEYFHENGECDPHAVAKEINGYFTKGEKKGQLVPGFGALKDDGSTSSGNWLYCGSYTGQGNMSARRTRETEGIGLHPEWSWCWPLNRRILYNRASVDLDGQPYDPQTPVIRWVPDAADPKKGHWAGDVPDGGWPPMNVDPENSKYAFIMKPEGHARLFAMELADGPLPEHYEPLESPISENPFNGQMLNPASKKWTGPADAYSACGSEEFPYVCTTCRLTEHWQTGVMSRHTPWLLELQPQLFVEMSWELAGQKGIEPGDLVEVRSMRGAVTAVALPTARFKPFAIRGKTVHHVALPWCFGWKMPEDGSGGDSANLLTPNVGDANTMIPETKAFLVDVNKLDVDQRPQSRLVARREDAP
ncbi:MAG: formate dehydrogenase-N subunit alpha [Planctomycetota bacterium]|jgi:formate dehydrogenase major subunit